MANRVRRSGKWRQRLVAFGGGLLVTGGLVFGDYLARGIGTIEYQLWMSGVAAAAMMILAGVVIVVEVWP